MFHVESYMQQLIEALEGCFGNRLMYVGLQGSYIRGEATERSDIDAMIVIENLTIGDLEQYRRIICTLPESGKSCGFICGREELKNWNPLEICHLLHSTRDLYGRLSDFLPDYTNDDVRNFAKLSVNNLYHEICHRYLHAAPEKNVAKIAGSFKNVFFILQNTHYLDTGVFASTKKELLTRLSGKDALILRTAMELSNGVSYDFPWLFELLYSWCKEVICRL